MSVIEEFLEYADKCGINYCFQGRLVRTRRIDSHQNIVELAEPEPVATLGKYKRVHFRYNGKKKTIYEHRAIIALVYGMEVLHSNETVDHINGDPLDNRIENLEVVSRAENYRRAWQDNFLLAYGEESRSATLSEEEIKCLRREYMTTSVNCTSKDLYKKYGISHSSYCRIVNLRSRWRDESPEGYLEFIERLTAVKSYPKYPKKRYYKEIGKHTPKNIFYQEVLKLLKRKEAD